MCFSATASFGLSGLLLVTGGYCLQRSARGNRSFVPLAVVPIGFGVQQFFEGCVWLALGRAEPGLVKPFALAYLFFALLFWPVWIPLSAALTERRPRARRFMWCATWLGLLGGLVLYAPFLTHPGFFDVTLIDHSIHYTIEQSPALGHVPGVPWLHDAFPWIWQVLYILLVSTPLLASSERRLADFGFAVLLSAVVSHIFFSYAFESVWCYFAAVMAFYLVLVFWRMPRLAVDGAPAIRPAWGGRSSRVG
ncbi:MAG: hypothetical protein K8S99_10160 [Planctomycetes bacterium]|nr:hypothetical protein [Planctomycetota bacterium]